MFNCFNLGIYLNLLYHISQGSQLYSLFINFPNSLIFSTIWFQFELHRVTNKKPLERGCFLFVTLSKQTALLASGNRTAESCFQSFENRRAGDQTKLFDEKVLVEVDKATAGPGFASGNRKTFRSLLLNRAKSTCLCNRR